MMMTIRCAKCQKPVERWLREPQPHISSHRIKFVVWCHGEREECSIDACNILPQQIVDAVAFSTELTGLSCGGVSAET